MGLLGKDKHYFHHTEKEGVPYEKNVNVNVTEKRAPTDDSIKLLRELEQKALDNVIASIDIDNNNVKGNVTYIQSITASFLPKEIAIMRFNLNGKDYRLDQEIKREYHFRDELFKDAIQRLVKAISEKIAMELLLESKETLDVVKSQSLDK